MHTKWWILNSKFCVNNKNSSNLQSTKPSTEAVSADLISFISFHIQITGLLCLHTLPTHSIENLLYRKYRVFLRDSMSYSFYPNVDGIKIKRRLKSDVVSLLQIKLYLWNWITEHILMVKQFKNEIINALKK